MFKNYHWDWGIFLQPVSTGEPTTYLGWLIAGLYNTLILALLAGVIAFVVGVTMGVLRTTPSRWLAGVGTVYVGIFRNIPVIVQLFTWYFVLPEILPTNIGTWFKELPATTQMMFSAVLCLGLYMGARVCELIRSGIETLPKGQRAAGLALGFTLPQTYRYVLLPVGLRVAIPPLTSEIINLVKNSAVASTIGLLELSAQAQQLVDYTAHPYESFAVATAVYISINLIVLLIMQRVEGAVRLPGYIGGRG